MTDLFAQLADRVTGARPEARPRTASRFGPAAATDAGLEVDVTIETPAGGRSAGPPGEPHSATPTRQQFAGEGEIPPAGPIGDPRPGRLPADPPTSVVGAVPTPEQRPQPNAATASPSRTDPRGHGEAATAASERARPASAGRVARSDHARRATAGPLAGADRDRPAIDEPPAFPSEAGRDQAVGRPATDRGPSIRSRPAAQPVVEVEPTPFTIPPEATATRLSPLVTDEPIAPLRRDAPPVSPAQRPAPTLVEPDVAEYTMRPSSGDDRVRSPSEHAFANALDVSMRVDAPRTDRPLANDNEAPAVRVTIGRVEVRATIEASPAVERVGPALSLDDYLAGFAGGS